MRIIIDIPEELYKEYVSIELARGNGKGITSTLLKAIKEGTPLQKDGGCDICKFKHRCTRRPAGNAIIFNCFKFKKEEQ